MFKRSLTNNVVRKGTRVMAVNPAEALEQRRNPPSTDTFDTCLDDYLCILALLHDVLYSINISALKGRNLTTLACIRL